MSGIRCFIAIDLPGAVKKEIERIQTGLKRSGADVKWVNPGQIHLTLHFFKELPAGQLDSLAESIRNEVQELEEFEIALQGIGCFPNIANPRVIWIGIPDSRPLNELYKRVTRISGPFDPPDRRESREEERFIPHATVGRVRSGKNRNQLIEMLREVVSDRAGTCRVHEVVLIESRLGEKGPEYSDRYHFQLRPRRT